MRPQIVTSMSPMDSPDSGNRTAPIILQQSLNDAEARFSLQIPEDLIYFKNHFPDYPMLPGVVQTQWVINLAEQLLENSFLKNFSAMTKLKFMRLITPGKQITLQLKVSPSNKSLSFRYFDEQGDYSSGQLKFN